MNARAPRYTVLFSLMIVVNTSNVFGQSAIAYEAKAGMNASVVLTNIRNQPPGRLRYEMMENLAVGLMNCGDSCLSRQDIDIIDGMLRDEDDSARFWMATILGNLGARAQNSIASLQSALAERPCREGTISSAVAVRLALTKLGAEPAYLPC